MPTFRRVRLALLALLLCATLGVPAAPSLAQTVSTQISLDSTQRVHPLLQFGAQADPLKLSRVIVQKTSAGIATSTLLALVPGMQLVEEYKVVPAFVATLPQTSVALLGGLPNVRYVSPDAAVQLIPDMVPTLLSAPKPPAPNSVAPPRTTYDATHLLTTFPIDTGAAGAWTGAYGAGTQTGTARTVAVIDSGIDASHPDLAGQVIAVNVNKRTSSTGDGYGHGTHVAGLVNGHDPAQQYLGTAPNSTLLSVKVADDTGQAFESDLLRGLDWVELNRAAYKIRALNLSVSTSIPQSYATSAIDAAVERLWTEGVVVVVSAGNLGNAQDAVWYAPANDPLVITVGCLDENQTVASTDDSLCPISSRGVTEDGFAKPDIVAPGRKIVGPLGTSPSGSGVALAAEFPDRITSDGRHIRLSGTSMAAPQVAGAVALLLQRHGGLTPNQIKQILKQSARTYPGQADAAGRMDIGSALLLSDNPPADKPQVPMPVTGVLPPSTAVTVVWDGARWGTAFFDGARWGSTYWDGARWGAAEWDGARWGSAYWDGARWGSTYWDGARWGGSTWDNGSYD